MRALVLSGAGDVSIADVLAPTAGPDEVLVDIARAGICGSDLNAIRNPGARMLPLILGHEAVGVAQDGRRVVINPIAGCAECNLCRSGSFALCERRSVLGNHRHGVFAEQVVVDESSLHELPSSVTFDQAAVIEPFATAIHAWSKTGRPRSPRIGIIGAGALGVLLLLAVRDHAAEVVVTDVDANRRRTALDLGASSVAASLNGTFDIVFDVVGLAQTRAAAVAHLTAGGQAVFLGLQAPHAEIDVGHMIRNELRIVTSFAYSAEAFVEATERVADLRLDWITYVPLDRAPQLLNDMIAGERPTTKVVFTL